MEIKIGRKYLVKSWEEMESKYGLNAFGGVNTFAYFTKGMRKYCGTIVTVKYIDCNDFTFLVEEDERHWWDKQMLKPLKNSIFSLLEERNEIQSRYCSKN